jgi:hypothetical protein
MPLVRRQHRWIVATDSGGSPPAETFRILWDDGDVMAWDDGDIVAWDN